MPEQNPMHFYDWGNKLVEVHDCLEEKSGDTVVYNDPEVLNAIRRQRNRDKMQAILDHEHDFELWDCGRLLHCKDSDCGLVVPATRVDDPAQNRPVNEHPTHHRSCLIRYGGGCSCG